MCFNKLQQDPAGESSLWLHISRNNPLNSDAEDDVGSWQAFDDDNHVNFSHSESEWYPFCSIHSAVSNLDLRQSWWVRMWHVRSDKAIVDRAFSPSVVEFVRKADDVEYQVWRGAVERVVQEMQTIKVHGSVPGKSTTWRGTV